MKFCFTVIVLLICPILGFAQQITVIDQITDEPISGVAIAEVGGIAEFRDAQTIHPAEHPIVGNIAENQ